MINNIIDPLTPTPPVRSIPWIILILGFVMASGLSAIVAVGLFGPVDKFEVLLTAIGSMILPVLGLLITQIIKTDALHVMVNSQRAESIKRDQENSEIIRVLTLEVSSLRGYAAGVSEGKFLAKEQELAERRRYEAGSRAREAIIEAALAQGHELGPAEANESISIGKVGAKGGDQAEG